MILPFSSPLPHQNHGGAQADPRKPLPGYLLIV